MFCWQMPCLVENLIRLCSKIIPFSSHARPNNKCLDLTVVLVIQRQITSGNGNNFFISPLPKSKAELSQLNHRVVHVAIKLKVFRLFRQNDQLWSTQYCFTYLYFDHVTSKTMLHCISYHNVFDRQRKENRPLIIFLTYHLLCGADLNLYSVMLSEAVFFLQWCIFQQYFFTLF